MLNVELFDMVHEKLGKSLSDKISDAKRGKCTYILYFRSDTSGAFPFTGQYLYLGLVKNWFSGDRSIESDLLKIIVIKDIDGALLIKRICRSSETFSRPGYLNKVLLGFNKIADRLLSKNETKLP